MRIPHENLYYLLLYAWDRIEESTLVDVGTTPGPSLLDLLARVLNGGVHHLLRRGLDRGYRSTRTATTRVRGRILVGASIASNQSAHGRLVCEHDELTHDVLHNQILKTTLERLLRFDTLDAQLRHEIAATCRRLHEVVSIDLTPRAFGLVQLHGNIRVYGFLLDVCRFVFDRSLPTERGRGYRFPDFGHEEAALADVFERFVRNFYRRHARGYSVGARQFAWADVQGTEEALALVPTLNTDTSLVNEHRHVVVETKYTPRVLHSYRGRERLRSEHLFQLFAYLANLRRVLSVGTRLEGILLYPAADRHLDQHYRVHGIPLRVYTLDLDRPWRSIHDDLLRLLVPHGG